MKRKHFLGVVFLLLFAMATACMKYQVIHEAKMQSSTDINSPLELYTLSWSDEFESLELDASRWKYRIGASGTSFQLEENVKFENGKLRINLLTEPYEGMPYTGGGIITTVPSRYGYYEVSAKMSSKKGWHEAFWTSWMSGFDDQNPDYEGMDKLEIDCFEHYAEYDEHTFTYGAIEWYPIQGSVSRDYKTVPEDLANSYNTFGFEFTPDYLNYFFNGKLLKTVDTREVPHHDFYVWLSGIAKDQHITDSGAVFFDYLRYYEISPANYEVRKVPFINYLDSLKGPLHSEGVDLWAEAEDFKSISNWKIEKDDNRKVIKGFTQVDPGRDSAALTAKTGIHVNTSGNYRLWVRARDFDTAPGTRKFKVKINGTEANAVFGNHGINGYEWQDGGVFNLPEGINQVDIFDSSQYSARCDKILLTTDTAFVPWGIGGDANVIHNDLPASLAATEGYREEMVPANAEENHLLAKRLDDKKLFHDIIKP